MKARPLSDKVIIQQEKAEDKHGRIHLPDSARKKPQRGKVIAVGPGAIKDDGTIVPMQVRVGETVLFARYGVDAVKELGDDMVMCPEEHILAVLD